jgi:hypothetical protein
MKSDSRPAGEKLLVSLKDAAAMLSISPQALHIRARSGVVPSLKLGRRRLFAPDALRVWIAEQAEKQVA